MKNRRKGAEWNLNYSGIGLYAVAGIVAWTFSMSLLWIALFK